MTLQKAKHLIRLSVTNNNMWKCPKCGRTFCNDNQHHFCGKCKGPKTIDEYIDEQGEDIRPQLEQVRNAIR